MKTYDLIIIGSGGGSKLRPAAELGKKVAIIEKDSLGGTCLNRGCIPSKMLIHAADLVEELHEYSKHNIKVDQNPQIDWSTLVSRVTKSVSSTSDKIGEFYKKMENIDYYHGAARFLENKVIEINGEQITAEKIFISVGTRPSIPPIPGLEGTPYMTSTEALRNTSQPKKMLVIGAGYIATELGYFYGALGTEVQFVVRSSFLKNEDEEVQKEFQEIFTKKFKTHLGYTPERVEYKDGIFQLTISNREGDTQVLEADALFVATGITSNTDTLSLENTDIEVDARGYIKTDQHLQTTVPDVYALGDCNGRYFFRHSVNFEGEYLLETLYTHPSDKEIEYPPMPHAVFTNPQIAGVAATEQELKAAGVDYISARNDYKNSAMGGDALQSDYGFCKLLFERQSRKLLGAHILGKEASDMIHMLIAFINMNATLDDMLRTIYIHPALPEIVRNAARKAQSQFG